MSKLILTDEQLAKIGFLISKSYKLFFYIDIDEHKTHDFRYDQKENRFYLCYEDYECGHGCGGGIIDLNIESLSDLFILLRILGVKYNPLD